MQTDLPPLLEAVSALADAAPGDPRPQLLRVLTDMYVSTPQPNREQREKFEELALGLIAHADEATLLAVATRLAPSAEVPPGLLARLIDRGGAPARVLLAETRAISREALWTIAANADAAGALAIAGRADLDSDLMAEVLQRGGGGAALVLAGNAAAPLDDRIVRLMLATDADRHSMGSRLAERRCEAATLVPALPWLPAARRAEVLTVALLDARAAPPSRAPYTPAVILDAMEGAALAGAHAALAEALGELLRVDPAIARSQIACGDLLALMLCAIGMGEEQASRVMMFATEDGQSVEGLARMRHLHADTPRVVAMRLVLDIAGATTPAPRLQPAHVFAPRPSAPQGAMTQGATTQVPAQTIARLAG